MQLARRPASHPPDQRQGSAVTYVALCVVSANAVKKRFFNYRATLRVACSSGRSASSFLRFEVFRVLNKTVITSAKLPRPPIPEPLPPGA
ncbi:hypothetical protein BUE60_28070 [Pseudomonas syringae pv. actinidiae]|nr:hypothetical protein BUE60_28070 [Pseudomonas syringae pv. actinidiae]